MINNLNILLPEVFLSLSIFASLMLGVFIKKSYNLITQVSSIILIISVFIIYNNGNEAAKIFSDSFISNSFTNFFKMRQVITIFITQAFYVSF